MTEMPADPFTGLMAAATGVHEMYSGFVDAGFTDAQAMQLVIAIITTFNQGSAE